jgi:hypothetical protein
LSCKSFSLYYFCTVLYLNKPFCIYSFKSWRMPLQCTTLLVAALVHLLELAMLTCWIARALKRNLQKLVHGRFIRMSSSLSTSTSFSLFSSL